MKRFGIVAVVILILAASILAGCDVPAEEDENDYNTTLPSERVLTREEKAQNFYDQQQREADAFEPHAEDIARKAVKSPDGQWSAWIVKTVWCERYGEEPYGGTCNIHVKKAGVEHQLDQPGEYREKWFSDPVFSPNSKKVAVYEAEQGGTGNIYVWTLPDGKLKTIKPKRWDICRIGFDKKGHVYIGPEHRDYGGD